MIVKFDLTVDINPETLECKILRQTATKPAVKKEVSDKIDQSPDPKIVLEDNKYILNNAAAQLTGVEAGDRVTVRYLPMNNIDYPVFGKQEVFNIKSGNKVTKDLTVSCRGSGHDRLSVYGSIFDITPLEGREGVFLMTGNKDMPTTNIKTEEIDTSETDNDSDVDLDALQNLVSSEDDIQKDDNENNKDENEYTIDSETLKL